jgi:mannosyltransferase OCH1-like enzyme
MSEKNNKDKNKSKEINKSDEKKNQLVKKIWQTWKIKKVPLIARIPFLSWYQNKGWERALENDEEIEKFIYTNFPDLKKTFNKVPFPVMKADIWRYCVIYKNGGLYTDLDTTCMIPIERWLPPDAEFVFSCENRTELFCQWTFYAKPGHYILKRMIELLKIRMKDKIKFFKPMVHFYTGPTFFTLSIVTAIKEMLIMEGENELASMICSRLLRRVPFMKPNNKLKKFLLKNKIYIFRNNVFDGLFVKHHYGGNSWNCKGYVPWKLQKKATLYKMMKKKKRCKRR